MRINGRRGTEVPLQNPAYSLTGSSIFEYLFLWKKAALAGLQVRPFYLYVRLGKSKGRKSLMCLDSNKRDARGVGWSVHNGTTETLSPLVPKLK